MLLLLGRLSIGCVGRTTAVSACMCASLNQTSNPLLPTCHLHQLCVDAPEEGPEGAVEEEPFAWAPPMGLITASPFAFASCFLCQLLMVSRLSSQPLSTGMGLRDRGFTLTRWELVCKIALKITNNIIALRSVRRGLRELLKINRFLPK